MNEKTFTAEDVEGFVSQSLKGKQLFVFSKRLKEKVFLTVIQKSLVQAFEGEDIPPDLGKMYKSAARNFSRFIRLNIDKDFVFPEELLSAEVRNKDGYQLLASVIKDNPINLKGMRREELLSTSAEYLDVGAILQNIISRYNLTIGDMAKDSAKEMLSSWNNVGIKSVQELKLALEPLGLEVKGYKEVFSSQCMKAIVICEALHLHSLFSQHGCFSEVAFIEYHPFSLRLSPKSGEELGFDKAWSSVINMFDNIGGKEAFLKTVKIEDR